jgi:hypothetical protein
MRTPEITSDRRPLPSSQSALSRTFHAVSGRVRRWRHSCGTREMAHAGSRLVRRHGAAALSGRRRWSNEVAVSRGHPVTSTTAHASGPVRLASSADPNTTQRLGHRVHRRLGHCRVKRRGRSRIDRRRVRAGAAAHLLERDQGVPHEVRRRQGRASRSEVLALHAVDVPRRSCGCSSPSWAHHGPIMGWIVLIVNSVRPGEPNPNVYG